MSLVCFNQSIVTAKQLFIVSQIASCPCSNVVLLYLVLVDSINKLFVSAGNCLLRFIFTFNHNYNKILKSDWLSTALNSALIGQLNRTVRVMPTL